VPPLPLPTMDVIEVLADAARSRSRVFEDAGAIVAAGVPWAAAWDLPYQDADAFLRGHAAAVREAEVHARRSGVEG